MDRILWTLPFAFVIGCSGVYGPIPDPAIPPSEAAYVLVAPEGRFGSARVVAGTAADVELECEQRAVVSFSVLVDNEGDEDVRVDAKQIWLAHVDTTNGRIEGDALFVVRRSASEVEDGVARVEAAFALPDGHTSSEVKAFTVRWSFERDGETFREFTPFVIPTPAATPLVLHRDPIPPYGSTYPGAFDGYYYTPPSAGVVVTAPVYTGVPYPSPPSMGHTPAHPTLTLDHVPATPSVGSRR